MDDPTAVPATPSLQDRLGYRFARPELLAAALTHRSATHELGGANYERLEFLGDAVLGLVTADWLCQHLPDVAEGTLARLKSYLVSARALAQLALDLDLGSELRLGAGEERSGGRVKRSLLVDSMEAVIGSMYVDGGLEVARRLLLPWLERTFEARPLWQDQDAKTELQELLQGRGLGLPEYRVATVSGPEHRRLFEVVCELEGEVIGAGSGASKKRAQQQAARAALDAMAATDRVAAPPLGGAEDA